ncbi:MAG: PEGA domain-containing protein [Thermoguttaceae bacterium]
MHFLKIFFCLFLSAIFAVATVQLFAADEPPTELYVSTVPEGAKVFIGSKELGATPGLFKVEPGSAKIVVKLEGKDTIERDVEIRASRITRLMLNFNKKDDNTSTGPERIKQFTSTDAPISGDAKWDGHELVVKSDAAGTVRLFELPVANRDQCVIFYRMHIKTENLKSSVYPEMWCRFPGKGESFSRGLDQKISGTNNWASLQIPFYLKKGELPDMLKLNLVFEGPGSVRLKDIQVLVAPLPENNSQVTVNVNQSEDITTSSSQNTGKNLLKNSGVEDGKDSPDGWKHGTWPDGMPAPGGVTYTWDKKVGFKSNSSLCITKTAQRYWPIAQWSQTVDRDPKQIKLLVSAQIKALKVAKAILDVQFLNENGMMLSYKWVSFIGIKTHGQSQPPIIGNTILAM